MSGGRWRRALVGRDVGLGYALIVATVAVVLAILPSRDGDHLVLQSSTNLANLRVRPLFVLLLSAFVVPPSGMWILPVVVLSYGAAQRWLGRLATVIVAAFGHVGASLFVAVLIASGIAHHQLDRLVAHEPDVGVSYGVAAILGILTARRPAQRTRWVMAGTALLAIVVLLSETFTDVGHLVAWGIGVATGVVVTSAGGGSRTAGPRR